MLYNKNWEKTHIKADPFSLESLIAWLEKQPTDASYNWHNCEGGCLIGLYGSALGLGDGWMDFHTKLYKAGQLSIASQKPHTFGAALKRARKALAER